MKLWTRFLFKVSLKCAQKWRYEYDSGQFSPKHLKMYSEMKIWIRVCAVPRQSNLNMFRNKDIDKILSVSRQNSLQYYQKWQNLRHLNVNMKIWTRLSSKLWRSVHLLSKNWIYKHDSRYKVHSKRWVNIERSSYEHKSDLKRWEI